jgi:hypothetical protein
MATVTPGIVWTSGETVTPTKLNAAAAPTVVVADGEITTARILDGAVTNAKVASGLDASKLTTGTLPADRIGAGAVTNARLSLAANAGEIKKALNADNSPPIYACRAWVAFNGATGSTVDGEFRCTIRASGNVSKVVRTSTGNFTVTFTTNMPAADYAVLANESHAGLLSRGTNLETLNTTASGFVMVAGYANTVTNGLLYNPEWVNIAVFA